MLNEIAHAIEGPHRAVPVGSHYTLDELREVRWNQLSEQDRGMRLASAQAVLDLIGDQVFYFRINDGPEQIIHVKTGIYVEAIAAIPAVFGIDTETYPLKIEIWVPALLPDYGPYTYGIMSPGSAVGLWIEKVPGQVTLVHS